MRTVYCDFAGSATLRTQIHQHCSDALAYSRSIGGTHWRHWAAPRCRRGRDRCSSHPRRAKSAGMNGAPVFPGSDSQRRGTRFSTAQRPLAAPWLTVVPVAASTPLRRPRTMLFTACRHREGYVLAF